MFDYEILRLIEVNEGKQLKSGWRSELVSHKADLFLSNQLNIALKIYGRT